MWFVVDMLIGVIDGKVIMMRFCSFWYYVGDFVNVFFRKEIYLIGFIIWCILIIYVLILCIYSKVFWICNIWCYVFFDNDMFVSRIWVYIYSYWVMFLWIDWGIEMVVWGFVFLYCVFFISRLCIFRIFYVCIIIFGFFCKSW